MSADQVQNFLKPYLPGQEAMVWGELDGSPQFDLFRTPYFLKLLCEQVKATATVPKGRAGLFTGFVRQVLHREVENNNPLLQVDTLLTERDHKKLVAHKWRDPFELPERGVLIPKLIHLAFAMQEDGLSTESKQVRIDYDDACNLLDHERDEDILKAGVSLSVLDGTSPNRKSVSSINSCRSSSRHGNWRTRETRGGCRWSGKWRRSGRHWKRRWQSWRMATRCHRWPRPVGKKLR